MASSSKESPGQPTADSRNGSLESSLSQTQMDMIHAAGSVCQAIGLPKSVGQVFGYLYLSTKPQTLDEISAAVQISKASASNSVRQLAAWGTARTVWVMGARREHYEVIGELNNLISGFINEFLKPKFSVADKKMASITETLDAEKRSGAISEEEFQHYSQRIRQINKLQKNLRKISPLVQRLI